MSEYLYEINGYTVGVDKSEKHDELALCITRKIEDKIIVEGILHGRLAGFVDLILKENIMLKNDFVSEKDKTKTSSYINISYIKQRLSKLENELLIGKYRSYLERAEIIGRINELKSLIYKFEEGKSESSESF